MQWDPLTRVSWLIALNEVESGKQYDFERGAWPNDT
jgi:hypothetical protein